MEGSSDKLQDDLSEHMKQLNVIDDEKPGQQNHYSTESNRATPDKHELEAPGQNLVIAEKILFNNTDEKHKHSSITGLVYDAKMSEYSFKFFHVERPERILRIYERLVSSGLAGKCKQIKSRLATKEEILLEHDEKHVDFIASLVDRTDEELEVLGGGFESIYFHPKTSQCALLAAGCTLELVDRILGGDIINGAAVIRPPGHHALRHCSMGFCHFNNVALAAKHAITKYGLKRILIVDWDIHYGNGTHKMFEDDPRVLYFSLHRYQYQQFWPNLYEGNFDAIGKGPGLGFNIHVAWNQRRIRDCEYLYAFDNLLIPVCKQYNPELILVSCGFDSGKGDPLGRCNVTPTGYAHMTRKLMDYAGGKIAIVLEGGYNLTTISYSMEACVSTLLGDPMPELIDEKPNDGPVLSIVNSILAICDYWTILQPKRAEFEELKTVLTKRQEDRSLVSDSSSSEEENEDYNEAQ